MALALLVPGGRGQLGRDLVTAAPGSLFWISPMSRIILVKKRE